MTPTIAFMDYAWRVAIAVPGFLSLRRVIYPDTWSGSLLPRVLHGTAGIVMVRPIATLDEWGRIFAVLGLCIAWFPYRRLFRVLVRSVAFGGLARLADEYGAVLFEDSDEGLFTLSSAYGGYRFTVGNVSTQARSIHLDSDREETYDMLSFVVELPCSPNFECSILRGWTSPNYHDREWRTNLVVVGDHVSMSIGEFFESTAGRVTGGDSGKLRRHSPRTCNRELSGFSVLTDDPDSFERVFDTEMVRSLNEAAGTFYFEVNVTPTSTNAFTSLCGHETQKKVLDFLIRLAGRLDVENSAHTAHIDSTGSVQTASGRSQSSRD